MSSIASRIWWALAGNIYSDVYEEQGDGGPRCHAQMDNWERVAMNAVSAAINIFLFVRLLPRVAKSRELNLSLPRSLAPNAIERVVGVCSAVTYCVMVYYKLVTGRGVFLLNPCHWVLLMQSYMLLTPKTRTSAFLFITYVRWLFGPMLALVFPDTKSMQLPLEVEFFYIEHYLAAVFGPMTLLLCGRYGFFEGEAWGTLAAHQWWGFAIHSLEQRVINHPVSLVTWANINGILCYLPSDPCHSFFGKLYLYFADHYLNFGSIVFATVYIVTQWVARRALGVCGLDLYRKEKVKQ